MLMFELPLGLSGGAVSPHVGDGEEVAAADVGHDDFGQVGGGVLVAAEDVGHGFDGEGAAVGADDGVVAAVRQQDHDQAGVGARAEVLAGGEKELRKKNL